MEKQLRLVDSHRLVEEERQLAFPPRLNHPRDSHHQNGKKVVSSGGIMRRQGKGGLVRDQPKGITG